MYLFFIFQVTNIKNKINDVRNLITNKDQESPETLRKATQELQQASLKLFEAAYKKVFIHYFKLKFKFYFYGQDSKCRRCQV